MAWLITADWLLDPRTSLDCEVPLLRSDVKVSPAWEPPVPPVTPPLVWLFVPKR